MRATDFSRVFLGGIWALVACSSLVLVENRAWSEPADDGSGFDHLDVIDTGLKGKLAVLRVGSERTINNLLSVFAGLKNKTARNLTIEVQTIYKDSFGNDLSDEKGGWISLKLKPHEEMEYHSASLSEDAADFLVRVRRPVDPAPEVAK